MFGQSAGAQSVFIHMMSSKSDGLFRAAIIESAPFAVPYRNKEEALFLSRRVSEIIKCEAADIVCLRNKSVEDINEAQQAVTLKITSGKFDEYFEPIGPIVDGDEITVQPMVAAMIGSFRKIPVILGTVSEEGRFFVYSVWNRTLTKVEYESALAILHPTDFRKLEEEYHITNETDLRDELSQVVSDYLFTCATRNATQNIIKRNDNQTYLYVFDHATEARGGWGKDTFCEGHACHASELGYVFQNRLVGMPTAEEDQLSELMLMYWSNFAHTLNPNSGPRCPKLRWPVYRAREPVLMYFQTPESDVLSQYRKPQCDFWDSFGFNP